MKKNIILIGFMGTGKSAVGQRLAQRLRLTFVDTDREIEKLTGMKITEIFRKHGEKRFRSEEKILSGKLAGQEGLVVSCGGGMVLDPENMRNLSSQGIIIRLEASPEDIFQRVIRKRHNRPLIGKNFSLEQLRQMMAEREAYYQCADFTINSTGKSIDELINIIINHCLNDPRNKSN